ncbi:MAG: protein kinase domain-containing protein [Gemmatimonadaceae bacterium]
MTETKTCPQCGRTYGSADRFCTVDGAALIGAGGTSLIGTVVADRFLVMEKLGEGGMGEVYLAEHVRIKRKVALKLMRPWMLGDPVAVGRFHREAENASQISHPNVAQVYDFGETAERVVYLAMEFVDGEPLSRILEREGSLHTVRTAELVRQVGEALTAAHHMGILHRDLKPDNVMVGRTRYGTDLVKLVDFGIARAMHRGTQQFTSTGMVVGTPDYMSPEQLSGDELDGRSDLYALGLIAFRLLTGSGAYPEGSSGEAMIARLTSPPRRLAVVRPELSWPGALQAAFDRVLAADPKDRFSDAMEFVAELDAAVSEMPLGEQEQAYLLALSQKRATPSRQGAVLDAATPVRGTSAIRADTPMPISAVLTPPERERIITQPLAGVTVVPPLAKPAAPEAPIAGEPDEPAPVVASAAGSDASRKRRGLPLALAGVGVAALAVVLVTQGGDEAPASPSRPADSLAIAVPPPVESPVPTPVQLPAAGGDSLLITTMRRATLAAWSPDGQQRGVAVLTDSSGGTGLALTAATLVSSDSGVDVFTDQNTRIRATVLSIDKTAGLATLLLPMRRCRSCALLPADAADPAVGDTVLFLPVGTGAGARSEGDTSTATIATFDGRRITTSETPRNVAGAPVVSRRTGRLIALGGSPRLVAPTALRDAIVAGKIAARTRTPRDSVVPIWPATPVRGSLLGDDVMARLRSDIEVYRVPKDRLTLVIMTPQVMKYREDQNNNPMNIPADPIRAWSPWRTYVGERRAVVVLNAAHKDASFPTWTQRDLDFGNTDIRSIRLFRNDSLVASIETGTFPALTSNGRREIKSTAIAVYSPFEFRSGNNFVAKVVDARGTIVDVRIPPGALEAVRSDFRWLFR